MNSITQARRSDTEGDKQGRGSAAKSSSGIVLESGVVAFIFLFTLGVCLWQNPSSVAPRMTLYFDGGHYLESCRSVFVATQEWLRGAASQKTAESVAYFLGLDGPVLPVVSAVAFALAGKMPAATEWPVLVNMQCMFQALAATGIYLLGRVLTGTKLGGVIAGLAWALYPATIVSCGLFLTEPLACLLSVSAVVLLYYSVVSECKFGAVRVSRALLTGAVLGALVLLKPALLPAAGLVSLLALVCAERKGPAVLASLFIIAGSSLIIIPWHLFMKQSTGMSVLLPSRRPVYNIATGLNIDSDGWGCHPPHPVTALFPESDSGIAVASGLFSDRPAEVSNLLLRKVTRLWGYPWNDYRYRILGLNCKIQAVLQLLAVLAALCAGVLHVGLSAVPGRLSAGARFIGLAAVAVVIAHLCYLPFEGIARYGFTSMPFVVLMAVSLGFRLRQAGVSTLCLAGWIISLLFLSVAPGMNLMPWFAGGSVENALIMDLAVRSSLLVAFCFFSVRLLLTCVSSASLAVRQNQAATGSSASAGSTVTEPIVSASTLPSAKESPWRSTEFDDRSAIRGRRRRHSRHEGGGIHREGEPLSNAAKRTRVDEFAKNTEPARVERADMEALDRDDDAATNTAATDTEKFGRSLDNKEQTAGTLLEPRLRAARGAMVVSATALGLAGVAVLASFSVSPREPKEWQSPLRAGMSAVRQVAINQGALSAAKFDWAVVLVDGGGAVNDAVLTVNGHAVQGKLGSLYQFYGAKYELQSYINMFASLIRQPAARLRQWQAVQIDPSILREGSVNEIKLTAGSAGKVTIFGDYLTGNSNGRELYLPGFEGISPGRLFNGDEDELDCRLIQHLGSRTPGAACYLEQSAGTKQQDLSSRPGTQTGQYRMFIVLGYAQRPGSVPGHPGIASLSINPESSMECVVHPTEFVDAAGTPSKAVPSELSPARVPYRACIEVPSRVLNSNHVEIEVSGGARSAGTAPASMGVSCVLQSGNPQDLACVLPGSPVMAKLEPLRITPFTLKAEVPSNTLRGPNPSITIELTPAGSTACGKLTLVVRPVKKASFEGHSAKFF